MLIFAGMKRYLLWFAMFLLVLSLQAQNARNKVLTPLPEVTYSSSYDETGLVFPGLDEPAFEQRFKPLSLDNFCTDSVRFDIQPEFILDNEYIVRGVPFIISLQGRNTASVSYPDTLSIPLHSKADRLWLLMNGNVCEGSHVTNALVIAHYQDGSVSLLPLIYPDNWNVLPEGEARRLCFRLNPDKKLVALEIRPLLPNIRIGLMSITMQ